MDDDDNIPEVTSHLDTTDVLQYFVAAMTQLQQSNGAFVAQLRGSLVPEDVTRLEGLLQRHAETTAAGGGKP